ncbi:MAG: hypothetical protein ACR2NZ_15900 [Rubripirellula sp.]
MQTQSITLSVWLLLAGLTTSIAHAAQRPTVHFDLPPTAAAEAVGDEMTLVTVELSLSSMIDTTEVPRIDQWLVRCQPRGKAISIADYAPRTETSSDLVSSIQVKRTEEESNSLGVGVNGNYGHAVHGNAGLDHSKKNTNSMQFDRVAPLHAVTASGTINRGRGVYFKLRWTAQQVLEGEKTFRLTLRVPATWRGGLVDVSVLAQSEKKSFAGWDRETQTLGSANFVVAVYRQGDRDAAAKARTLSDAEFALRSVIIEHRTAQKVTSIPSMLRHVAKKFELESVSTSEMWLQRLLLDRADAHMDAEIRKLPMPVRVAVLDYVDERDNFLAMHRQPSQELAKHRSERPSRAGTR